VDNAQPTRAAPAADTGRTLRRPRVASPRDALADQLAGTSTQFTPDEDADRLIREDPFAFLLAVISDMGIRAERAWALPYHLRQRLGFLTPRELAANHARVSAAVQQEPKLHRFVNNVPAWLVQAAQIVLDQYQGDAARIWSDTPTATVLRERLESFPGIGQKKAAMAVEILARDLGVHLREMGGSDIAYDVHVRRVFLRTGLASRDEVTHMVAVARTLNPERPGALDLPAWASDAAGAAPQHQTARHARSTQPAPASSAKALGSKASESTALQV
jgi:uncharacterized HhH-GPD family protein